MSSITLVPPPGPRRSMNQKRNSKKFAFPVENGTSNGTSSRPSSPPAKSQFSVGGERTVKNLRLSKALTIPEGTTVQEACRRMTARRADAVLLTDSNGLLSGIATDKDISTRFIAEGLRPNQTTVSKIMTRNPIFVTSDTPAIEALQKMILGKFRHLPVVEEGEVIALLDITKCLYDAIAKLEKAAKQGSAIAAAVEGMEFQLGSNLSAPNLFMETLRERMFKPSLSSIVDEKAKVAIALPSDPVYLAAKRMRETRVNSAIIVIGSKVQGILTSKDILMRVVAQNLSPELTLVEKVMTPNPKCATLETTILDALHIMHDGKFLHLPVVDKDGSIAACVDVLQLTSAAISMVENSSGAVNDMANTMMRRFWDSALSLDSSEDYDMNSETFGLVTSDGGEHGKSAYPSSGFGSYFDFKFEDAKGHVHRIHCDTDNLGTLVSAVLQRIGHANAEVCPLVLYEDDEGDRVLLTIDGDLNTAVSYARSKGSKSLRLYLDYSNSIHPRSRAQSIATKEGRNRFPCYKGILAGAVALTGITVMVYLNRYRQ